MHHPCFSLHVAGEWRPGARGAALPVEDPATEAMFADVASASSDDVADAVAAAHRGFGTWRRASAYDRGKVLRRAADLLRERSDAIAAAITREEGKPLFESRAEATVAADTLDWYAAEAQRAGGRLIPARASDTRWSVELDPVGPVAALCAWNAPLVNPVRKVAPALAAGCTVVLKASEETPAGAVELVRALVDAGLPAGAINLLFGNPGAIATQLIDDGRIAKLSFTGSVPVGRALAARAGERLLPATLELGGHGPVIVCADADIERLVPLAVLAKCRNAGQICFSPTRFIVARSRHDELVVRLGQALAKVVTGPGDAPGVGMGPVASRRRAVAVNALVDDALARGAHAHGRTDARFARGHFVPPVLMSDVSTDARLLTEEPFGPVAIVIPFDDLEGAIAEANRLRYALGAYVFTQSAATARHLVANIEAGTLAVNSFQMVWPETPFGGMKDSGNGREGGSEGFAPYVKARFVNECWPEA